MKQRYEKIKPGGVWELFLDYGHHQDDDYILKTSYTLLKTLWELYYKV